MAEMFSAACPIRRMGGAVSLDVSPSSVVAVCGLCGWRAATLRRPAALVLSARHVEAAHGSDAAAGARRTLNLYLSRHRRAA